jgi:hypothetical protein
VIVPDEHGGTYGRIAYRRLRHAHAAGSSG